MNDNENRRHQMLVRAHDFGLDHGADFAPTSLGKQLFTTLGLINGELNQHVTIHASARGVARQGTATRSQAREELRQDLIAINRTARAMSAEVTGLDGKFRLPPRFNDQELLAAGRGFELDATPFASQLSRTSCPRILLTI